MLPSKRAPVTDPYEDWYASQRRRAVGSSSSHRNTAAQPMNPAASPFVPSAAAVGNKNDEVSVVRRFLEDAGLLSSDECVMTRTEMLYFVKGRMS